MLYLLDANVMIRAHEDYYPISRIPQFWVWLVNMGENGNVKVPYEVYGEIAVYNGPLRNWLTDSVVSNAMLLDQRTDPNHLNQVLASGYAPDLNDSEIEEIGQDPFLIAYAGASETTIRGQKALRLPLSDRRSRVSVLVNALAHLSGGAKQTIHYTDLTPAVTMLAITRHGNNPFYRMLGASRTFTTEFHRQAFEELMQVYARDFLSPVYIGWAHGFLDEQRARLEQAIKDAGLEGKVSVAHPVRQIEAFAEQLRVEKNGHWFD